jgi:hypothetical protein
MLGILHVGYPTDFDEEILLHATSV